MSNQPPSSGRFGSPILEKIIQGFAKQAAQADATATAQAKDQAKQAKEQAKEAQKQAKELAKSGLPVHPALTTLNALAHILGPNAQVEPAQTYDDMLYEAQTRQRAEWMVDQGVTGLADHGAFRTPAQRAAMSPWPAR